MRYYRGSLLAVRDANGASRAVNVVPLDQYVRGVVPREVSASWADQGSGAGFQAVKAQAIAARWYAWSESRELVTRRRVMARVQVYSGAAVRSVAGVVSALEDPRTDRAVAETSGQVRIDAKGAVARTDSPRRPAATRPVACSPRSPTKATPSQQTPTPRGCIGER